VFRRGRREREQSERAREREGGKDLLHVLSSWRRSRWKKGGPGREGWRHEKHEREGMRELGTDRDVENREESVVLHPRERRIAGIGHRQRCGKSRGKCCSASNLSVVVPVARDPDKRCFKTAINKFISVENDYLARSWRKAPVVNSVEVIGLWLSFPNNKLVGMRVYRGGRRLTLDPSRKQTQ